MRLAWIFASCAAAQLLGITDLSCEGDKLALDISKSVDKGPSQWPGVDASMYLHILQSASAGSRYKGDSSLGCSVVTEYNDGSILKRLQYQYWSASFQGLIDLDAGVTARMTLVSNWTDVPLSPVTATVDFTGPLSESFKLVVPFNGTTISRPGISASATAKKVFWTPCNTEWTTNTTVTMEVDNSKNPKGSGKISMVGDDVASLYFAINSQSRECNSPYQFVFEKPKPTS